MAITALQSAATGMNAMDTQLDVIANNLANSNTAGFKSQRANFEDLFYEVRRQPGALNTLGQLTSTGLFVGLGAKVSNTQLNMKNGSLENTGRPLDVGLSGEGFFKVQTFEGIGSGEGYTRAGNFIADAEGNVVLGTADGPKLDPPITLPTGYQNLTIQSDGTLTVEVDGSISEFQIKLFRFPNPHGLKLEGGNIFTETEASGAPVEGNPADPGYGKLSQGFLETSNVDPVKELVSMIRTQRSFELNSQTIRAADENLQVVSRLRR